MLEHVENAKLNYLIKTLAFPKLLYVCNMKNPPLNFIKGVKEAMVKFIWKGNK